MTAIGAVNTLRILASQALEAASMVLKPFRPADDEISMVEEKFGAAGRAAATRFVEAASAIAGGGNSAVVSARGLPGIGDAGLMEALGVADEYEDTAGSSSEITYLDEIAGHLAAQTPLLEDIRNLLNASAAPGLLPHQPPAAAAEREPAPGRTDSLLPGAGHLTATPQCLRVAARGLRQWIDGDACSAPSYWRSIAASLDAVATAREAINDITQ